MRWLEETENVICLGDEVRKARLRWFGHEEKDGEHCGWLRVAGRRHEGDLWMW